MFTTAQVILIALAAAGGAAAGTASVMLTLRERARRKANRTLNEQLLRVSDSNVKLRHALAQVNEILTPGERIEWLRLDGGQYLPQRTVDAGPPA